MQADRDQTRKEYDALEIEFTSLQSELRLARGDAEMLGTKLVAIQLRVSQLDLMFNSLLKGSWMNYRALVEAKIDPPYLPPKEYITGPLQTIKQYPDEGDKQ
jgi:hypothetical protein